MARLRKAGWGGKRKGAGRKHSLQELDREDIARDYFVRMRSRRQFALENDQNPPRRADVIKELMTEYSTSGRMVERCISQFLPSFRSETAIWEYATENLGELQRLPAKDSEIRKLKAGDYIDKKEKQKAKSQGDVQKPRTPCRRRAYNSQIMHSL